MARLESRREMITEPLEELALFVQDRNNGVASRALEIVAAGKLW
jgi:hypothetical protein